VGGRKSVQLFGPELDVLLARPLLFPILADPGFPTLARGGVAAGEGQARDIGIGNAELVRIVFRE